MENKIDILHGGYVLLHDHMGSDLSVSNSARVSYNKKKEVLDEKDQRLIQFLAREGHTSPFRHATLQFEIYAPLVVARQMWKHIIGSSFQDPMVAWNESSRRYITEENEFYIPLPTEWRSKPENSKQGSGEPVSIEIGDYYTKKLQDITEQGQTLYDMAMADGIAPELARLFLPAYSMFVRYYWTASLQGVAHFLDLRLASDAQSEIQELAQAVHDLAQPIFPYSMEALLGHKKEGL